MWSVQTCPYCKAENVVRSGFSNKIKCLKNGEGRRQRYFCNKCRRRFSDSTGLIFWGQKKSDPALNSKIFQLNIRGLSNRMIGRYFHISEHCVRLRLVRLARQALNFQSELLQKKNFKITEPICMDGLENFAGSQYDINNLQQALGKESLFIYDFNLASLNRKGRMSPWQKRRLFEIEKFEGRYNPRSIRVAARGNFPFSVGTQSVKA